MVARKMWFGNTTHAQWVPCPATGLRRTRQGWSEELAFENGGAWLEESAAWHTVYEMEFPVADSSEYDGIEAFERFAAREYGDDYLRFVDPMQMDRNLLSPVWANPSLIEQGWKNPFGVPVSYIDGAADDLYPPRAAILHFEEAPISVTEFVGKSFTLLIPPGHYLRLGGYVQYSAESPLSIQFPNGTFANVTGTEPWPPNQFFDNAISGDSVPYVRLGFRRVAEGDQPVAIVYGLLARLVKGSPPLPSTFDRWMPGEGHSGLRFRGKALPETYVMKDRHLSGMSAELIEVEPWED